MSTTPENLGLPESPGSLADYMAERTHHAVAISRLGLVRGYFDKVAKYRKDLAEQQGLTPEELHDGVRPQEMTAQEQKEGTDVQV